MSDCRCNRRSLAYRVLIGVLTCGALAVSASAWAQLRPLAIDLSSIALPSNIAAGGTDAHNTAGDFAFADRNSGAVFLRRAGASSIVRVLQMGDAVPGLPGTRLDIVSGLWINQSGLLCLMFDFMGGPVTNRIILTYDGSAFHTIAAGSDAPAGAGGAVLGRMLTLTGLNSAGDVSFTAPMIPLGATSPASTTLFIVPSGGSQVRVAGPGDTAPDTGGATISAISAGGVNNQGDVLFRAALSTGGYGYFVGSVTGVRKIVAHGDPKPGGGTIDFSTSTPSGMLNNMGQVAFRDDTNTVYLHTAASGLVPVLGLATPVPAPLDTRALTAIASVMLNDSGDMLFTGTLSGTAANNSAVFRYTSGNPLEISAYKGQTAPGMAGVAFASFSSPQMNGAGDVAFAATTSGSSTSGLFEKRAGLGLVAVAQSGQVSGLAVGGVFSAPSYLRLIGDGSVYFESAIAGGTATYGCFVTAPTGLQTLVTDLEPLPPGSRVVSRTLFPIGAGNYVGWAVRRTGSNDTLVLTDALNGTTTKVAAIGDAAPGGGTLTNSSWTTVYVNVTGAVAFSAAVSGVSGHLFVWDAANGLRKLAGPGDAAPGTGTTFTSCFLPPSSLVAPINAAGQVVFRCAFSGGSGIYVGSAGSSPVLLVKTGDAAPSGGTFSGPFNTFHMNDSGQVAFASPTSSTAMGIFTGQAGGTLSKLMAVGDPGPTGGTFSAVQTNSPVDISHHGDVPFFASITGVGGSVGLFVATIGGPLQVVALNGSAAPTGGSYNFTTASMDARINVLGDIFFLAPLAGGAADSGYFLRRARTGVVETVAVQGQTAPGTGSTFTTFGGTLNGYPGESLALGPTGEALFRSVVSLGGTSTTVLYRYRVSGVLERILTMGDPAPGSGGGTIASVGNGFGAGRSGLFFLRVTVVGGTPFDSTMYGTSVSPAADLAGIGHAIPAVFRPSTATWYMRDQAPVAFGQAGDIPVVADYNGDGKAEIAVYRPSTSEWIVQGQQPFALGQAGDVPVAGDYNGDGKAERAIFRPSTGEWTIDGQPGMTRWGMRGDIPAPADYNGDGVVELAVFRPTTGAWYVMGGDTLQWGMWGDVPVPGDYNGDGKAEIAVYRPSTGWWYVARGRMAQWGTPGDIPAPLDMDGDGVTEFVVFRPSDGLWYAFNPVTSDGTGWPLGQAGDQPVGVPPQLPAAPLLKTAGDFDHDGSADVTIFRPSTGGWYTLQSTHAYRTLETVMLGQDGDVPVPGDYQGTGYQERATYRPSTGEWLFEDGRTFTLGAPGDVPVPGDYDGDAVTDIAVFTPGSGLWSILSGASGFTTLATEAWGASGDVPVPGDYDGDHKTDCAVFTPATGQWSIRSSVTGTTLMTLPWGMSGDIPVAADYDGDGTTDIGVYRPATGCWYGLFSGSAWSLQWAWWGAEGDIPVPGDYDGDGKADLAVFRPSNGAWYVMDVMTIMGWGNTTDVPILNRK